MGRSHCGARDRVRTGDPQLGNIPLRSDPESPNGLIVLAKRVRLARFVGRVDSRFMLVSGGFRWVQRTPSSAQNRANDLEAGSCRRATRYPTQRLLQRLSSPLSPECSEAQPSRMSWNAAALKPGPQRYGTPGRTTSACPRCTHGRGRTDRAAHASHIAPSPRAES
jgi:hypothetical protein